jgi:hypothetical protein
MQAYRIILPHLPQNGILGGLLPRRLLNLLDDHISHLRGANPAARVGGGGFAAGKQICHAVP